MKTINRSTKILVVDDDHAFREALCSAIESVFGVTPMEAADGANAIQDIDWQDVRCVVTDTNMPRINGIELLTYIKQRWPEIHVVVLFSGLSGSKLTRLDVLRLGADVVITKGEISFKDLPRLVPIPS